MEINLILSSNTKDWTDHLQALLTPTIGVLGIYIAVQQWKTSESKRRFELFELRYENLYKETINTITYYKEISNDNNKFSKKDFELKHNNYLATLKKYGFLIKTHDLNKITELYQELFYITNSYTGQTLPSQLIYNTELPENLKKFEFFEFKIYDILAKYLRIEHESFFEYHIKNVIIPFWRYVWHLNTKGFKNCDLKNKNNKPK